MRGKKISTTVYLTEEQLQGLKDLNQRTRVPIAEYIRMGIDKILDDHREQLPGQVELFEGFHPKDLGVGQRHKKTDDDPGS